MYFHRLYPSEGVDGPFLAVGGGGGTFVALGSDYTTATPLIVAGGGGGAYVGKQVSK